MNIPTALVEVRRPTVRSRPGRGRWRIAAACVIGALQAACGSSAMMVDAAAAPTRLEMPSVALSPGDETTQCVVVQMANATPQILRRVRAVLSAGSHHLVAYRVPADTPLQPAATPCQPFADVTNGVSPVIIAESKDAEVVYPDGVGLEFEVNQKIKLEEHSLNASDAAILATGTVDFTLVDPTPDIVLANLLFWGPQQFAIDPHAAGSAELAHVVNPGVKVFGLTTHEHHFGTLATIELATDATGPATELYRNTDWEHPPLKAFDPPLTFDGTQWLRLHCDWFNNTDVVVPFGVSAATNEMCFFWAYYYPSQGLQICSEAGCRTGNPRGRARDAGAAARTAFASVSWRGTSGTAAR